MENIRKLQGFFRIQRQRKKLKKKWMEKGSKLLKFKDMTHGGWGNIVKDKESKKPWVKWKKKKVSVTKKWKLVKYKTHRETGKTLQIKISLDNQREIMNMYHYERIRSKK